MIHFQLYNGVLVTASYTPCKFASDGGWPAINSRMIDQFDFCAWCTSKYVFSAFFVTRRRKAFSTEPFESRRITPPKQPNPTPPFPPPVPRIAGERPAGCPVQPANTQGQWQEKPQQLVHDVSGRVLEGVDCCGCPPPWEFLWMRVGEREWETEGEAVQDRFRYFVTWSDERTWAG